MPVVLVSALCLTLYTSESILPAHRTALDSFSPAILHLLKKKTQVENRLLAGTIPQNPEFESVDSYGAGKLRSAQVG